MNREKSKPGVLYVVATPIGNLEDLSPRAKAVLAGADLVAAEDTRRTRRLLSALGLKKRLISYREQNREQAGRRILEALAQGQEAALVSDAGTPVVSDPGSDLVARAWEAGMRVVPIPGPSAVAAALSASGLPADRYFFAGFPPAKAKARRDFFDSLRGRAETLVFYEAPHRLAASLADLATALGPRPAVLGRELTKLHEEVVRDDLAGLAGWAGEREIKGELTLVVAGAGSRDGPAREMDEEALRRAWQEARAGGLSPGAAAVRTAGAFGLARNRIYKLGLEWDKEESEPQGVSVETKAAAARDTAATRRLTVTNKQGLHARSATRIIQLLQLFDCQATFSKDGRTVGGESILSLLTLNCPRGSVVEVRAEGPDAERCLDELTRLFDRKFDEGE